MSSHHESTSAERKKHLDKVGWEPVSKPCCSGYTAQTGRHHPQNEHTTVLSKPGNQCDHSKQSDKHRQGAMNALFGWHHMRQHCGEGQQ